ncbi:MAG: response regulator [Candidatus Marinimicrobia bacterium]|nr:response regulator [Candidatus Neomarinimicrobiota bacterium]
MAEKKIILTIDDEEFIRSSFRTFLEDFGYEVLEAADGCEGLEVFTTYQPDLILLDLKMPVMDGFEVLEKVLALRPDMPVIVVSGVGVVHDAVEALRRGASDYLIKPIPDLDVLRFSVKKALEKAQLIAQNKLYQEKLEEMVNERTYELEQTNKILSDEIEHRKKAEEELNNSQLMLSSILETVPDIIYRLDKHGRISFISDAVKNYGYLPSDFINRYMDEFIHPEDQSPAFWHVRTRRANFRRTINYEIRLFPYAEETNYPIFMLEAEGIYRNNNKKQFAGTQGVARDITQRKEAENKIKQTLMEKESLLREVHHRVKNNLQVILSMLNLQLRDISSEEIQKILKEIQNRIQSMAIAHELIYKVEDFSHIRIDLLVRNVFMQAVIACGMASNVQPVFEIEELSITLDSAVPLAVILNEIFVNLFKYSFPNHEKAEINVSIEKSETDSARLVVADNGVGIAEILDPSMSSSQGISLMKTLTKQINGELKVENSQPGTQITILFKTKINQSSLP